jgi:cytidylate kinase
MDRIHVIGASGSGKSTLANQVAERLRVPFFATDSWFWKEGWVVASAEEINEAVRCLFENDRYVMDGNFDHRRHEIWTRADCIVWLDYPLRLVLKRVASRNLSWWLHGERGWSPSRWTLHKALDGIAYSVRSHVRKRCLYPGYLSENATGEVFRLKTPQETAVWLSGLPGNKGS